MENKNFLHNKNYPKNDSRYDFYLVDENKYVEVTGYTKKTCKWWFSYLRKIVEKRKYALNFLKASFEFKSKLLTKEQIAFVRSYMA